MAARAILATALVAALSATVQPQQTSDDQSRREAARHYRAGQEFYASEKFDRAVEEFTKAIENDKLFTLAYYFLGQSYGNQRRYASAIKAYQDCIDACRAVYALRQTNRFEAERRREDTIRELRQTIEVLRTQTKRVSSLGSGLSLQTTQLEQQLQNLERSQTSVEAPFQAPAEVLLALGSALYHNNQIEEAEREWLASIEVNPKLGEAHNNLAALYLQQGRLDVAESELKLAEKYGVRVNPELKKDLKSARSRK